MISEGSCDTEAWTMTAENSQEICILKPSQVKSLLFTVYSAIQIVSKQLYSRAGRYIA